MEKNEVLRKVRDARARLEALLARLTPEQMLQPGVTGDWSVKDILGHIIFWEQDMLVGFERLLRGEAVHEFGSDAEIDALNAATYARYRDTPLAEMQTEFARSHAAVLAWLEAASEETLARPFAYRRTVAEFVPVDTWEHYDEHVEQIEAVFGQDKTVQ